MKRNVASNGKHKRGAKGTGRLYKRDAGGKEHPVDWPGVGAYWLAYSIPNPSGGPGKRIRQALHDENGNPVTDRKQAEAARRLILAPYQTGNVVETLRVVQSRLVQAQTEHAEAVRSARGEMRVADVWEAYVKTPRTMRPDSGPGTMRQYEIQWSRFARWIMKTHPEVEALRGVTEDHAAEYATDLQEAGLSGATINKHVTLLRLVFRVLGKQAGVTVDPWGGMRPAKHRPQGRRELTLPELRRVCESAEGELRLLFAVGLYSGLRLADCALLRWDEVDFGQNVLMVTPRKTCHTSGKQVRIPLHPALQAMFEEAKKTATGEYVLPETAATYEERRDIVTHRVQRYLWENGIDCHAKGTGQQIERDGQGEPVRDEKGRVRFVATGRRAVVSVGFHSLRHSFVSMCRAAGVSLSVVESLVGHSNPTMTRLYTHTSGGEAEKAVKALPTIGGSDAEPVHEPLPKWARDLAESMNGKNWKSIRATLLGDGRQTVAVGT